MTTKWVKRRRSRRIRTVVFVVALTVFLVSAYQLLSIYLEYKRGSDEYDSLAQQAEEILASAEAEESGSAEAGGDTAGPWTDFYNAMVAQNEDYVGWITIEDTKIDYPIVQFSDNSYYLNHTFEGQENSSGTLFIDCGITEGMEGKNVIVYGHNMKNGSMFANLTKYRNLDFYKQNPTLEFSTLYKSSTYKVFSVFVLNASKEDDNGYIYNISRKNFLDDDDFNSWADEAYQRSLINTGVDVVNGDNIITLVTCVYDFDDARLVVMARETREGEDPSVDTSSASVNPSPRYPKRWYDDRGLDFPFD